MHINGYLGRILNEHSYMEAAKLQRAELDVYETAVRRGDWATTLHQVVAKLLLTHKLPEQAHDQRITTKRVELDGSWFMDLSIDKAEQVFYGEETPIWLRVWGNPHVISLPSYDKAFVEYSIQSVVTYENLSPASPDNLRVMMPDETRALCVDVQAAYRYNPDV